MLTTRRLSEARKGEIVRVTQRTFKNDPAADEEFSRITLQELVEVDQMLGDRDLQRGYRLRIRDRIDELREAERNAKARLAAAQARSEERTYSKRVRLMSLLSAFVLGILTTFVGQLLWSLFRAKA